MIDLDGEHWAACLAASFGAQVHRIEDRGATMAVFPIGPWRIGFVDFLSGTHGDLADLIAPARTMAKATGTHVLRFVADQPIAGSSGYARYPQQACRITDLRAWRAEATDKGRRTLNRRARTALAFRAATRSDAAAMHALYAETVSRHGGAVRYNLGYFEALAPHAGTVALLDGKIVGFVCIGYKGGRGLYLHGAHAPSARAHYPSDLLYLAMLEKARDRGMCSFDFLASPHPGLLRYKQAWGGERFTEWTCDLPMCSSGRVFVIAYAIHQRWKHLGRSSQGAGARATRRTSA